MTQQQFTVPSFSYDAKNNCLCVVLRVSGSRGGQAVGDTFCIDAESGKLSQLSSAQRMAELEQANPEGGKRKLSQSPDGSFKLTTFNTNRQRVQADHKLDLPGYTPTLVNDRYVVSHDEAHIHVWGAQNPEEPVKSLPAPVRFSFNHLLFAAASDSITLRAWRQHNHRTPLRLRARPTMLLTRWSEMRHSVNPARFQRPHHLLAPALRLLLPTQKFLCLPNDLPENCNYLASLRKACRSKLPVGRS